MKGLTAAVETQLAAINKRPVLLFELGLTSTLYFCAYKTNIVFPTAGQTYTAKAITVDGIGQNLEGQVERITVKFDNTAKDMAAYANAVDFRGKKLVVKRIYLDAISAAGDYVEVFNGVMENPSEISRASLTVSATGGKPLNRNALKLSYQRQCPWIFGGIECNTDGLSDLTTLKATGTADSGTTSTLVDAPLTQANDYWNYGEIIITKAGIVYRRKVKDFVSALHTIYFDVELPVTIDNTCTYVLYKGCDQTWNTCGQANAWGPSGNNKANFSGCIHISKKADSTG